MQILKEDCPKEEGNDRSLPYTAYVIEYKDKDGGLHYDISISDSTVDIFDSKLKYCTFKALVQTKDLFWTSTVCVCVCVRACLRVFVCRW